MYKLTMASLFFVMATFPCQAQEQCDKFNKNQLKQMSNEMLIANLCSNIKKTKVAKEFENKVRSMAFSRGAMDASRMVIDCWGVLVEISLLLDERKVEPPAECLELMKSID